MKQITVIEAVTNLGLKEPAPNHEPGVRHLPKWLRQHNFHNLIEPFEIITLKRPPYDNIRDK